MSGEHTKRIAGFSGDDLRVQFSPEVTEEFSRLEAAVHDSEHFSPDILPILRDMAKGKPVSVRHAILGIAVIVQEAGRHTRATGDEKPDEIVDDLLEKLVPNAKLSDPVTVTKTPDKVKRGAG
jgi:hypothetical protein